jgi:acetyltransferase
MATDNLEAFFRPNCVVLLGASAEPGTVGALAALNLQQGGFQGEIMFVNPHLKLLNGLTVYPDIGSLHRSPDLAVIATPPGSVPTLITELGARGTKAAIIITAGFGELGQRGKELQQATLDAARPYGLRLIGPNCVGVLAPQSGLNAGFSHLSPQVGDLALVSQSGAMVTSVLDWATPQGIGFSHVVSLGDMADVDFGDMLDYLAVDQHTRGILLYIEGIQRARQFMSAARAAARNKPVVVVKVGRHAESARAAASHTGALAGSDAVYNAAFRRAGMLRVLDTEQLFDAVETLARTGPQRGERLAILTNGGGPGVIATDTLIDLGGCLAQLSPETLTRLDTALPKTWSRGNPVDIIGDAPGSRYAAALDALLDDAAVDAVLVLNCPTAVGDPIEAARAVIATVEAARAKYLSDRNVFTNWLGRQSAEPARQLFAAAHLPTYETPEEAVRGFLQRVEFRKNQELLMQVTGSQPEPERFSRDIAAGVRCIHHALAGGREWLDSEDVDGLLRAYGIPTPELRFAPDAAQAAKIAASIGFPVVLKISSRDITHKTDVGGVALNLSNPEQVRQEAIGMLERVKLANPNAEVSGFTVQQMVVRPNALELIVGVTEDSTFGPVVLFGHGGIAVQAINDTTLELPPLNEALARAQVERTRVSKLLGGYRNRPAADIKAIAKTLVRVSQLVIDHAEICELDINPLLADSEGVVALDARVRVRKATGPVAARLAISPYSEVL